MTPQQAIARLKTLPEEKQRAVLSGLSPEERKGILAQLSQPAQPSAVGDFLKSTGKRAAQSFVAPITSPVTTGRSMAKNPESALPTALNALSGALSFLPGGGGPDFNQRAAEAIQENPQHPYRQAEANNLGDLLALGAQMGLGEVIPRAVSRIAEPFARTMTGTSPRALRSLVESTKEANKTAETANKTAAEKHLGETQTARTETGIRESQHAADVKSAEEAAQKETQQERRTDLSKHLKEKTKAETARGEAEEEFQSAKGKQEKIVPQEQKLRQAFGNLRAGIETAREKALKVGNEKYSGVNEALNHLQADPEVVPNALLEAAESLKGSKTEPTFLKAMEKRIEGGDPFTYSDLQGDYSTLGKELSKGTLPGDVYHAYDVLHETIGNEMQRIADSQGQGAALTEARAYWKRMKQTFGKTLSMPDAATKALRGSASGLATEDALQNQIRLLGSFDPRIPNLFAHVESVEQGLKALPKPVPLRTLVQNKVEATPQVPKPPPAGAPVAPKEIPPPARVEFPNRPAETPPQKIGPEEIRGAKLKSLQTRTQKLHNYATHLATFVTGYRALSAVVRAMSGDPAALLQVPPDILEGAALLGGGHGLVSLLESPRVVDLLTKPTAKDLAEIPPDLRGDLRSITDAAQKQGIKVSPKLLAIVGANQPKKRVASALTGAGGSRDEFMAAPNPKGLAEKGNLPIWNRPTVQNDDGSHSSEYSTSFEQDGKEVLVPTVVNGKFLTPNGKKPPEGSVEEKAMFKAAWQHYLKTGENLGKFDNSDDADAYAQVLHNRGNQ